MRMCERNEAATATGRLASVLQIMLICIIINC